MSCSVVCREAVQSPYLSSISFSLLSSAKSHYFGVWKAWACVGYISYIPLVSGDTQRSEQSGYSGNIFQLYLLLLLWQIYERLCKYIKYAWSWKDVPRVFKNEQGNRVKMNSRTCIERKRCASFLYISCRARRQGYWQERLPFFFSLKCLHKSAKNTQVLRPRRLASTHGVWRGTVCRFCHFWVYNRYLLTRYRILHKLSGYVAIDDMS